MKKLLVLLLGCFIVFNSLAVGKSCQNPNLPPTQQGMVYPQNQNMPPAEEMNYPAGIPATPETEKMLKEFTRLRGELMMNPIVSEKLMPLYMKFQGILDLMQSDIILDLDQIQKLSNLFTELQANILPKINKLAKSVNMEQLSIFFSPVPPSNLDPDKANFDFLKNLPKFIVEFSKLLKSDIVPFLNNKLKDILTADQLQKFKKYENKIVNELLPQLKLALTDPRFPQLVDSLKKMLRLQLKLFKLSEEYSKNNPGAMAPNMQPTNNQPPVPNKEQNK